MGFVVGVARCGCLEIFEQVLLLVLFELTAIFGTVDASAGLVMFMLHCSFLMLSLSIMISQTLKAHSSEP